MEAPDARKDASGGKACSMTDGQLLPLTNVDAAPAS